jgi:uncharacterized protein YjbI with pentapeptide repeats
MRTCPHRYAGRRRGVRSAGINRRAQRLLRLSSSVAAATLLGGLVTVTTSTAAFADTVIDGCTIVSNPTPTDFTNCSGDDLAGANLTGFNLSYADLSGANLTGASLASDKLKDADLSNASLAACVVGGGIPPSETCTVATLAHAKLTGATLSSAVMSACVTDDYTAYESACGGASLAHANLRDTTLTGDDLSWVDLAHANLTGATVNGTFSECAPATDNNVCSAADFDHADLVS